MRHITDPHLSTPEDAQAYESLLAALRKDLQLDLATDVLPGTSGALLHLGIARGIATLTWPGGSTFSNTLTVPHGLPTQPTGIAAVGQLPGGTSAVDVEYVTVDATNIQFRGHTTDGSSPLNTATTTFSWIATI